MSTTYPFRFKNFRAALMLLAVIWLIAEVLFGYIRTPVADHYVGDVSMGFNVNGYPHTTPINAHLELDVMDKGVVYGRVPNAQEDGFRIVFSGPDVEKLKAAGIPERYTKVDGYPAFSRSYCSIDQGARKYNAARSNDINAGDMIYVDRTQNGKLVPLDNPANECTGMTLKFLGYNTVEFIIDGFNKNVVVKADLRRDTNRSLIQAMIMKTRSFSVLSWKDGAI